MIILRNKLSNKYFERGKCFTAPRRCASELTTTEAAFVRATFDQSHIEEEDAEEPGCLRCSERLSTAEGKQTGICADCWTKGDELSDR